ncbi:MAG: helix-turn-helix domain-containing protein [Streptosporangiaceae bacterium]
MLVLEMPPRGLTQVRFGWSMLGEVTTSLWAAGRDDQPRWIRRWWQEVRPQLPSTCLRLLQELVPAARAAYIPEFMLPLPRSGASLHEELQTLATTPAELIRTEMRLLVTGAPEHGIRGVPRPVATQLLDRRGEEVYAAVLADQVHLYWQVAIAPYWPSLRAGLDRELHHRGQMLAGDGLAATFAEVSPRILWRDGRLLLDVRAQDHRTADEGLWCTTSVFLYDRILQGRMSDGTEHIHYTAYGAGAAWQRRRHGPSAALTDLFGTVRAGLLAGLGEPRTTADLALRQEVSPSTVSYHLGVLHRAGLLDRHRDGKYVLYHRTPLGEQISA